MNGFEGDGSNDRDRPGFTNFTLKRDTKVLKYMGQQDGVRERGKTHDSTHFGHGAEYVAGKVDGSSNQEEIEEFKGLIV